MLGRQHLRLRAGVLVTIATALAILSAIGTLLNVIKEFPGAVDEVKSLLEKVRPYATELGVDVATEFTAAEQRLQALGG